MNQSLSPRRLAGAATTVFALALLSAPGLSAQENPCAAAANPCAAAANPCAAATNPCAMKDMDSAAEMDKWITQLASNLDLSDEQVTEIKPILMASHEGSEAIMAKYDGEKTEAATEELAALRKDTMYQLDEVLTEEQMEKLHATMKSEAEHGEKMEKKKGY